jgi:hypothetical protein
MNCANCEEGFVTYTRNGDPETATEGVCDCCNGEWEDCQKCASEYYEDRGD